MGRGVQTSNRQQYVPSPDGTRFLMSSTVDDASRSAITVVLNWQDDRSLSRRVRFGGAAPGLRVTQRATVSARRS